MFVCVFVWFLFFCCYSAAAAAADDDNDVMYMFVLAYIIQVKSIFIPRATEFNPIFTFKQCKHNLAYNHTKSTNCG
jgi:hypothetical protein